MTLNPQKRTSRSLPQSTLRGGNGLQESSRLIQPLYLARSGRVCQLSEVYRQLSEPRRSPHNRRRGSPRAGSSSRNRLSLPSLSCLALPYPTLPDPTRPDWTLPYPTLPYPTLPYPTLTCPTLPYPTLPYNPTIPRLLARFPDENQVYS